MFRSVMSSNFSRPYDFVDAIEVENKIVPEPVRIEAPAPVRKAPAPVRKAVPVRKVAIKSNVSVAFAGIPSKNVASAPTTSFAGIPSKNVASAPTTSFAGIPTQNKVHMRVPQIGGVSGIPSNHRPSASASASSSSSFSGIPRRK